jgi:hypothetical protein
VIKPSVSKICPYCCSEKTSSEFTREHLPAKTLYKRKGQNENANAAVINVCKACNNQKSVWDHEILALYGHPTDLEAEIKAQKTLKNPQEISNLDILALVMARHGTQTGNSLGAVGGIRLDIVSQWMSYVARGIYFFFEEDVFTGIVDPIPDVLPCNINSFDGVGYKIHKITELCTIALISKGQDKSILATVMLKTKDGEGWNNFLCFMHKTEGQVREFYTAKPEIPSQFALEPTKPRTIYEISKSGDVESYLGVKRAIKRDDMKAE